MFKKTPKKTYEDKYQDGLYMEITDEIRHEKNAEFFRKWGKLFITVASLILISVIISQVYKNYKQTQILKEALAYEKITSGNLPQSEVLPALIDLANNGKYGYKTVALFKACDLLIANEQKDEAITLLQNAVKSTSSSELKALTIIKLGFLSSDKLTVIEAKKLLKPILSSSSPLFYSAQNLLGVICLNNSDTSCAKKSFEIVANDKSAPADIKTFAINALNSIK